MPIHVYNLAFAILEPASCAIPRTARSRRPVRAATHRFMVHDRSVYSEAVDLALRTMGLRVLKTPVTDPGKRLLLTRDRHGAS